MEERKMEKINLIGYPLIFPKLTAYLILKGVSIQVSGKMGSDYRINDIIMKTLLTREWSGLPDVAYYNKNQQSWTEHTFESTEAEIYLGKQGVIYYSKQMFELQDERQLSVLCDYLRLNSSGSFVTKVRKTGTSH